ncbi:YihY/virulence factor BrkB family protein [Roseomonas sp. E05]|uniref:YihY/virulence factor BrkB family protein n=1 Tax=Roseomonas sp. E05 TaxID=3046310 RepID=UPI0024BB6320|nr:YihY/virulence factor BrkB family protein [Roseomonas sp. E05]MDJ0390148.1 YihY/virulence factor BrkB family protein [Roseomonas sp. E05]
MADSQREPREAPWRHPLRAFLAEVLSDHTQTVAAALAFHAMFGVLPALAGAAALLGKVADPALLRGPVQSGAERLLADKAAASVLVEFVTTVPQGFGFGLGLVLNLLVALWAAQRAASGLLTALNIVYDQTERRGWLQREGIAVVIAFAVFLLLTLTLALLALPPLLTGHVESDLLDLVSIARWPALVLLFALAVGALYTYAPSRARPQRDWASWGTVAATLLWVAASIGLSVYVSHAQSFGVFYGSLGGGVVLMMWFYLTALALLAGAEVNGLRQEWAERREDPVKRGLRDRERRPDGDGG